GRVGVQPARDVAPGGVVVLHEPGHVRAELALHGDRALIGARVHEVLVEDVHVGIEGRADLAGGDEVRIGGHGTVDPRARAGTEDGLAAAAVGGACGGQGQTGNASVEDAAVQ